MSLAAYVVHPERAVARRCMLPQTVTRGAAECLL